MEALLNAEAACGGRVEVAAALAESDDDRAKKLVQLMADPRRANDSLVNLCADAGVAPSTVLSLLRDASFTQSIALAQMKLATRMEAVVDRVADAAEGFFDHCDCTNGGSREANEGCPACKGTGKKWRRPSMDHQKLFMEATELLKRPGGPVVNVQQNVQQINGAAGTQFFDQLTKGLASALRPIDSPIVRHAPIDAELVPPDPPTTRPDNPNPEG